MNRLASLLLLLVLAALAIHCTRVVVLEPAPDGGFGSGDAGISAPADTGDRG